MTWEINLTRLTLMPFRDNHESEGQRNGIHRSRWKTIRENGESNRKIWESSRIPTERHESHGRTGQ